MIHDTPRVFVFNFFVFRRVRVCLRRITVQYYVHVLYLEYSTIPFLSRHLDAQFTDGEELYQL